MKQSVLALVITSFLIVPTLATAQDSSGTSRASGAATRSKEDAATVKTSVNAMPTKSTTRSLKFQFFNQSYAYQYDLKNGDRPMASNYTYFGLNYKFLPSQYVALRLPFSYYVPKFDGESRFEAEDVYLNYWHADLATLFEDTTVSGMVRVYFPTGEDSRYLDKRNGAVRLSLMTSTDFTGKLNLTYLTYVQQNNHTQETYDIGGRTWANIDRTIVQGPTLGYQFNDTWSVGQLVGTTHNFAETGDRYGDTEHFLNLVSSVYYQVNDSLSASLAFHDDVEMGDALRPFRLGMEEDITYIVSIAATL